MRYLQKSKTDICGTLRETHFLFRRQGQCVFCDGTDKRTALGGKGRFPDEYRI